MTTTQKIDVEYLDMSDSFMSSFRSLTMLTDEEKMRLVNRVYPDAVRKPGESVLRTWVQAVADANGVSYTEASGAIASPLRDQAMSAWIWAIA